MSKKVLIVEESLAVRGIAESLLRQNSYEVLSADSAAAAREILQSSKVDLLLVASDIKDFDDRPYCEAVGADAVTATIPLVILHDPDSGGIAYPPEVVINKPFTPQEFLDTVTVFSGVQKSPSVNTDQTPFAGGDLEEDLIDAALGLDKLEVDDAEVFGDDTGIFRIANKKPAKENMIGYEYKARSADDTDISTRKKKIDEINVPADKAPAAQAKPAQDDQEKKNDGKDFLGHDSTKLKSRPADTMSASSKIEIVTDQYGMISTPEIDEVLSSGKKSDGDHDYNWFVNEMQKETAEVNKEIKSAADSGPLAIDQTSNMLEPKAPAPKSPPPTPAPAPPAEQKQESHGEAVDKFISEFKKEMEKINDQPVSGVSVTNIEAQGLEGMDGRNLKWEEALEHISPADIRVLAKEIINAVASTVAQSIVARLDEEKIYSILSGCFREALEKSMLSRKPQ